MAARSASQLPKQIMNYNRFISKVSAARQHSAIRKLSMHVRPIMNYKRFVNKISASRKPDILREIAALLMKSPPTMISMAGGLPNVEMFPFQKATFTLKDGSTMEIPPDVMNKALQYSATPGLGELLDFVKMVQKDVHNPPLFDKPDALDYLITSGSSDGISKTFDALTEAGDNVLVENPTFSGTLATLRPLGVNMLGVNVDDQGMVPEHLSEILSRWTPEDAKDPKSSLPKLLYIVPNGGNPTGQCVSLERKKRIYEIARQYDLIILEDDPYFYLQFAKPYVPSFLSMDTDGRVVRFDSFSKLLSSGMRAGFLTGPKAIVERVQLHMQTSIIHVSGLTQAVLQEILKKWGLEGFRQHAVKVAAFYENRRDIAMAALNKHLSGLVELSPPTGGMFLWMKLINIEDTHELITKRALEKQVLFVPGNVFHIDDTKPSPYVRASYSLCSPEQMDQGFERLAALIKEEHTRSK